MAAQIIEEIKTFFTGDSTGLAKEADKAKKLVAGLQKDYSKHVTAVKGSILDPGSLVGKAGEKLASTLKLSANSMGIASAGGTVLLKTFLAANRLAGEQADKMNAISETMGKASRTNMFSSSLDGTATLVERLNSVRGLMRDAAQAQKDANPYGFGGGVKGTMRTAIGDFQMSVKSAVGLGPYSNFDRERDESRILNYQQRIAAQDAAHMRADLSRGLVDQLGMTQERLSGSSFNSRIAGLHRERRGELNSIRGTDAYTPENRRNIRLRYNEEIAAERELQEFSELKFRRSMQEVGISRSLVTDEEKRVRTLQKELEGMREQLKLGQHLTTETRQELTVKAAQQQTDLNLAQADLASARTQHQLAQDTAAIRAKNTSEAARVYETELATSRALREQLAAYKDLNTSRAQGLQIDLAAADLRIREAQRSEFSKGQKGMNRDLANLRQEQLRRDRLDHRIDRAGGLTRVDRNMAGDVIGGIDPLTGEYRPATPGEGLAERGLHTGKLSDKPMSTTGGASMVNDTDPDGGLHGGETRKFFDPRKTTAGIELNKPTGAEAFLAKHRGDAAHDPAARLAPGLAAAEMFPDLEQQMERDMRGRGYLVRPEPWSAGWMIHSPNQAALNRMGETFSKRKDRGTLAGARTALHQPTLTLQTGVRFQDPNTGAVAMMQIQTRSLETQTGMSVKLDKLITLFGNLPDAMAFK